MWGKINQVNGAKKTAPCKSGNNFLIETAYKWWAESLPDDLLITKLSG